MSDKISRRKFLKTAAVTGIGAYGVTHLPGLVESAPVSPKSRVAIISSPDVFVNPRTNPNTVDKLRLKAAGASDTSVDMKILQQMVDLGVRKLTGMRSDAAWKSMFKPSDVVGVKVNCLFGKGVSTRPETVAAVIAGLLTAGVKEDNIIVWDWRDSHLAKGGYWLNRDKPGIKCYAHEDDFDEQPTVVGKFGGRLSRILTETITALVNVPILKHHGGAGITCAMKNHYGSHHNPFDHHGSNCDPYIAELNSIPAIRDKTRLIVCEALKPLAHGGPGMSSEHVWQYDSILVSRDPVALDYQGWRIIEARRKETGLKSLAEAGQEPKWIATAASLGLGTNDPSRIEVIRDAVSV